jgi:hypothetical protein
MEESGRLNPYHAQFCHGAKNTRTINKLQGYQHASLKNILVVPLPVDIDNVKN